METSVRVKKEKVKLSGKVMCVTKTKVAPMETSGRVTKAFYTLVEISMPP